MLKAINPETQLVYICNPANPTATIVERDRMRSFCIEASKKCVVLIDEAYNEFMEDHKSHTLIDMTEKNPNLLVIKTFSKIHAMAGMRVGFIIGHPSLINKLQPNYFQNTHYAISNLSLAAAMTSLDDSIHQDNSRMNNAAVKEYTYAEMKKMRINYIPSSTNFIFYPVKNFAGNYSEEMYNKQNIILRSNRYSDGQWARVSIGTMDEMKKFCSTLNMLAG